MTQFKLLFNYMPRDLAEFIFFLIVGFTAGTLGFVWQWNIDNFQNFFWNFLKIYIEMIDSTGKLNLDLPLSSNNSTTVSEPHTSLPLFLIKLAIQSIVPPVASKSSTIV